MPNTSVAEVDTEAAYCLLCRNVSAHKVEFVLPHDATKAINAINRQIRMNLLHISIVGKAESLST